jgi:hypothetical protein
VSVITRPTSTIAFGAQDENEQRQMIFGTVP